MGTTVSNRGITRNHTVIEGACDVNRSTFPTQVDIRAGNGESDCIKRDHIESFENLFGFENLIERQLLIEVN
jgi:hypothetical protein